MTNKELVNQISGLNSTSTLKNWIQLIKEISGKEFKKIKVPISRNPRTHQLSYTVAYDFTDEDLRQFQKLANQKLEKGEEHISSTKTKAGTRRIIMNTKLVETLEEWKQAQRERLKEFTTNLDDQQIFQNSPITITKDSIEKQYKKYCKEIIL